MGIFIDDTIPFFGSINLLVVLVIDCENDICLSPVRLQGKALSYDGDGWMRKGF